jgi:2-isopropylmalate synthase
VSRIQIYDTTLRDGMQGEGMSLSAEEKVRVAHLLDELGIPFIEAGFPASNPKEEELFARLAHEGLRADVCAFGMTRRRDVAADEDPGLRLLADCFAPVCTLVGKTWALHLEKVVRVGRDENLRMIADSVAFLVGEGKRVIYDAEHFFDGWRSDPDYALACVRAATEAGAENATLCDTNGASLPDQVADAVREVAATGIPVGIHCHNDAECGVANSLAAVAEGAVLVQGTLNGYGERCGNANLTSIVPNLQLKLGHDCLPVLEGLTEASHLLAELLNLVPDANQPYVGKNAFAHKGGMHIAAVTTDPATFEHIDPAAVGNAREVLVSELSGKGTLVAHAGGDLEAGAAARVVERVKALEHRGFQFEAADGSLDLLIRRETGEYEPLFRLESWRVIAEKREDGRVMTEATIKIWVQGERFVRTAEGNGPVHALDRALRDAISETYPHLADIKLVNYKVRILDEDKATAAVTRVLLDASDGVDTWGAIGVHENVIEASWDALVDSLEAGMLPGRSQHRRGHRAPAGGAAGPR